MKEARVGRAVVTYRTADFMDTMAFLVGGAESYRLPGQASKALAAIRSTSPSRYYLMVAGATIAVGSGIGIGYWFGYDATPNCTTSFAVAKLNDPTFWDGVNRLTERESPKFIPGLPIK